MKNLILTLCFSFCAIIAWSQDGIFAFANKASTGSKRGAVSDHKFETATMVFDSLLAGLGDSRLLAPSLVMSSKEQYVAWAQPERAEIGLEELAYDICVSFGADSLNALAALLTHELVHYYEKHDWTRHFISDNEDLSTAQKLEKLEEGLKLETQADFMGGFWAYSVGFDVNGVMPELLKSVYAETGYDLPEEINGYPSLQDRIAMCETSMKRLGALEVVFEMANYLNVLEYYEDAELYYRYILRDFQSRDIYNNIGVTTLLSALTYFTKEELPYGLPIELDPKSRLERNKTRDMDQTRLRERKTRIARALKYFDQAISLDKHYAPAFLNNAAAFVLLQDWEAANSWIKKASKEDLNEKMKADLLVLKGVIAAQQEDPDGAREWWEKATAQKNDLAFINLNVLAGNPIDNQPEVFGFAGAKKEQIESLEVLDYLMETPPDETIEIDNRKACGFHHRPNSTIYSHLVDQGNSYIIVQIVDEHYSGKGMEGIAIGDSLELLQEKYGEASRQVQTPEGAFYIYPGRNMFFEVNPDTGVHGWGIYRIKE